MDATPVAPKTSGKAIASLVLSILGLVGVLPLIGSILGVILGNSARGEIARSAGSLTGEEMARIGVILGWVGLALWAVGFVCALLILGGSIGLGVCSAILESLIESR